MIEGWETKLSDYFVKVQSTPFKWGKCDCLIFASDACKIKSGKDPMSKKRPNDPDTIRGMYKTQDEARDLIKKYRKSTPDIMDAHFDRILPVKAQRGDVVFYKGAFGVSYGRGLAFFKSEKGMETIQVKNCTKAWRVD